MMIRLAGHFIAHHPPFYTILFMVFIICARALHMFCRIFAGSAGFVKSMVFLLAKAQPTIHNCFSVLVSVFLLLAEVLSRLQVK